jgi:hypothetical protein
MKIISRRRPKDPFATLSIGDLRKAETLLKYRIDSLEFESLDLKEQIQNLLGDGSLIYDEPHYVRRAMRIRTLIERYHMKNAVCIKLERDLRLVSSIISVRDRERVLNLLDVGQKLNRISPEDLEGWLARQSVHEEGDRHHIEDIHAVLSEHIPADKGCSVDETLIRQAMEDIREGIVSGAAIVNRLLGEALSEKERTRTTIIQYDKFPGKQGRDEQ